MNVIFDGRFKMMIVFWYSDEDFDCFDVVFLVLFEDNDLMIFVEFDGFCVGFIICLEMILFLVWFVKVWGIGGLLEFDSVEEFQVVFDFIMVYYNCVVGMLMILGEYFFVFDEDQCNGDIIWEFWMMGFVVVM